MRRVTRETSDVVTLELAPPDGVSHAPFEPGQFHMLYLFGVGEVPISIAGEGTAGSSEHTIRDVGAVTHGLSQLGPGDVVGVRGPFGSRWPLEHAQGRDVVIASGGIGIAPVRPIVTAVMRQRELFDDVVVLYGARAPSELLYSREYDQWRKAGIQVEATVDHGDETWDGHVGVVTTLIRYAKVDVDDAAAFFCGPELMIRFTARELTDRGVDPQRIYVSLERNMQCAVGFCGHCQLGPEFICLDGPVFAWPRVARLVATREL